MPAFSYTALDNNGKEKKGMLEGDNAAQIRQLLRNKNLTPLKVVLFHTKHKTRKNHIRISRRHKLSAKNLSLLTRQLATLLTAGMPIAEALQTVAEQAEKPGIKQIIIDVRATVLEGHSLAVGMKKFPAAFPSLYRATIAAGENSGHLDKVLERLADFTEKQHYTKQKIRQALIYPALMTTVSIFIVSFLLAYVVPRLVGVFKQTGQALPLVTQILLEISHLLKAYGLYALVVIIIAIFVFNRMLRITAIRHHYHKLLLRLPLIGHSLKVDNTAHFARSFGILSAASVPIIEAMHASNRLVGSLPIQEAISEAIGKVHEGTSIKCSPCNKLTTSPL